MKNLKSIIRNSSPDRNEKQNGLKNISFARFQERPTEVP